VSVRPPGAPADVLAAQVADARRRLAAAQVHAPLEAVRERALSTPAAPSFAEALAGPGVAVIAEVKRASPSRGPLAPIPDVSALAAAYRDGGAAVVSVLTAPLGFAGTLEDLVVAAGTGVPCLRKDFLVDPYQVWEARAAGASAVLLLAVVLDDATLETMLTTCEDAGLGALVEVHDEAEMRRAAAIGPAVVGVNVRDLRDFSVDTSRFATVAALRPSSALLVAESGVHGPDDVVAYAAAGADAVLVGEHLATSEDPRAATARLVAAGATGPASDGARSGGVGP
jgi:indole-3-glycerol phosphate synthase